ncbi:hypothetical protein [Pleomorphovibrio marinus]|uniref:hypothetical protein n=1 Tax=Pleomorphovibrio marinus TaxID=2164132 RepID=UPI000E0AAD2D|nr:hypothetical protein [Pleomorphovibrio marinus]
MKRIWLFVPDIFFTLLIVASCERVSLDQDRESEGDKLEWVSKVEVSTDNSQDWNKELADYMVKAKQILKRMELN